MNQSGLKIALVGDMLSKGGAEKVQARLSFFFESHNIEIHHIIVRDEVTYPYAGVLFNMGKLKNKSNSIFNKFKRLQALRKYLNEHKFDFIIDFRVKNNFAQEYIIANWVYNRPYIMSIRSFETNYYFPKNDFLAKRIYKKAYGFVTVSKALEEKIKNKFGYENVKAIYNPIDSEEIKKHASKDLDLDYSYLLGIGRMENNIKQFDQLIIAYNNSNARSNGMKLVLIGDGIVKQELKALVSELKIAEDVIFISHVQNPFPYYKKAFATMLTSKNEGFPNILIESLAAGTPVIAYDCESGPSEIIDHKENGLLVKNQDLQEMTNAIDTMISDKELYNNCKLKASESIKTLELNRIGEQWLRFMNIKD